MVFLAFIGLLLQSFSSSASVFQDLKDKVTEQNAKMDAVVSIVNQQSAMIQGLSAKIDSLTMACRTF